MRFTAVLLTGAFALASAQSTTTNTADAAQSTQQTAILRCLNACPEGDVDCTSKCISVPNPNESDANATNKCVSECPQGNGTATDNLNYANCVDGCISKFYYTITAPVAAPTGSSGSGSGGSGSSGGNGGSGGASPSGSGTGTSNQGASGSGPAGPASTSQGSAGTLAASSAFGVFGFLAALLAI